MDDESSTIENVEEGQEEGLKDGCESENEGSHVEHDASPANERSENNYSDGAVEHARNIEAEENEEGEESTVASIVVEIPQIEVELEESTEDPGQSSGTRRSTRSAAKRASMNIREAVKKRPYGCVVDSDEENDVKIVSRESSVADASQPPLKKKRGRPRKYPRPDSANTSAVSLKEGSTPSTFHRLQQKPNVFHVKRTGDRFIAADANSTTPSYHQIGTPKQLFTLLKSNDNPFVNKGQSEFGIFEEIGRHVRKAQISSSYTLKKLEEEHVLAKVTEILRPRSGNHSSYDVVTALVRLGVLCVDDPQITAPRPSTTNGERMKSLLDQLQQSSPGTSGVAEEVSGAPGEVAVLDEPSSHEDSVVCSDTDRAEVKYDSVLRSIPARRGKGSYVALNEAVWKFFVGCREAGVKLNGRILRQRAISIASRMGLSAFRSSEGWLNGFKQRHSIDFNTMEGVPFEYKTGFVDADLESGANSESLEPTVREVVTNPSYISAAPSDVAPTEMSNETSTISANQYVQQLTKSPNMVNEVAVNSVEDAEEMQEDCDVQPDVRETGQFDISLESMPAYSTPVIESIVRSCVYTVPNPQVQAAIATLRSFMMTSSNLQLLKPLAEIQEGLAQSLSTPLSRLSAKPSSLSVRSLSSIPSTSSSLLTTSTSKDLTSVLTAQMNLPNNNNNNTRLYKRVIPRTHLKYGSGRPPASVQFPKKRYIADPYRDSPTE